jgi:hypothetical protein
MFRNPDRSAATQNNIPVHFELGRTNLLKKRAIFNFKLKNRVKKVPHLVLLTAGVFAFLQFTGQVLPEVVYRQSQLPNTTFAGK